MGKVSETLNVGDRENIDIENLLQIIEDMYKELAISLNKKPDIITQNDDGDTSDSTLSNGDININLITNKVEMVTNHLTSTTVKFKTLS